MPCPAAALPLESLVTGVFAIRCFGDSSAILKSVPGKEFLMAQVADQTQHEFWRPPMPSSAAIADSDRSSTCHCGTEYIVSSVYCHACGASRPDPNAARTLEIQVWPNLHPLVSGWV